MPKATKKAQTIGELRQSGYKVISVKEEVRKNLIKKIVNNEVLFPGIIGFDDSVIPQLENAILAGQDIILLGERGQAKSRLIRQIVTLLDEEIPGLEAGACHWIEVTNNTDTTPGCNWCG